MELLNKLKKAELFSELNDSAINLIISHGKIKKTNENELLFFEGEEGIYFYILLEGMIKLYKSTEDGKEIIIRLVKPGQNFAEVILFEHNNYPVNAQAIKSSSLFIISKNEFMKLLQEKEFNLNFTSMLFKKMRYLAEKVKFLSGYDVEERFIRFLIEHYGMKSKIHVDLTKKEIAEAIGTIAETFSRMIKRLKNKNILKWENNIIDIDINYIKSIIEE